MEELLATVGVKLGPAKLTHLAQAYTMKAAPAGQSISTYLTGILIEQGKRRAAALIPAADRANAAGHADRTGEDATWYAIQERGY